MAQIEAGVLAGEVEVGKHSTELRIQAARLAEFLLGVPVDGLWLEDPIRLRKLGPSATGDQ